MAPVVAAPPAAGCLGGHSGHAGVYRFLDGTGKLAYVGMSKNLASRVRQHFNGSGSEARSQNTPPARPQDHLGANRVGVHGRRVGGRAHPAVSPPLNRAQKVVGKGWSVDSFRCRLDIVRFSLSKGGNATSKALPQPNEGETWLRQEVDGAGIGTRPVRTSGHGVEEGWVDNAAARALHNARADAWLAA